jgi:rhamnosyltransferase
MTSPNVLVLMACFNGAEWIDEQIKSILGQQGVSIRLVISDDFSSDKTRDVIEGYARSDDRIRLVHPPSASGSASKNFQWLIKSFPSDGDNFISFADQDDVWKEEKLSKAINLLKSSGAAGYSCAVTAFQKSGKKMDLVQCGTPTESDFLFEGAGQGCTFVLTAFLYEKIRLFFNENSLLMNGIHYHDWAVYALARSWGHSWCFDKTSMMYYRQHLTNDTGARYTWRGLHKRLAWMLNGWYGTQIKLISAMASIAAPTDRVVSSWCSMLSLEYKFARRLSIAKFCWRGGRRRLLDRLVLLILVTIHGL